VSRAQTHSSLKDGTYEGRGKGAKGVELTSPPKGQHCRRSLKGGQRKEVREEKEGVVRYTPSLAVTKREQGKSDCSNTGRPEVEPSSSGKTPLIG